MIWGYAVGKKSCSECLCTPLSSRIWPWERTPWRCCGARGRGVQLAPRSSSGGRETAPEALAGCYFHHSFSPMKRCSFFFLFPQGIFISLRVSRERFVRNNLLDPSRIISSSAWGRDAGMYVLRLVGDFFGAKPWLLERQRRGWRCQQQARLSSSPLSPSCSTREQTPGYKTAPVCSALSGWPLWRSAELFQESYPGSNEVFNPSKNKENRLRWAFESLSEDLDSQFPFK